MENKNIWNGLDFSGKSEESAYDLLKAQAKDLVEATGGILTMEVEAVDSYLDEEPPKPVALYMLYVVAPTLGNFRRKVLTVMEGKYEGRFPVDIFCHIDDKRDVDITKDGFIEKIAEIMSRTLVKTSIENLFKQSKEYLKNNPIDE